MSYVEGYFKCDCCGKHMKETIDTGKYTIMPRKWVHIRKFLSVRKFDIWSRELDICSECWDDMVNYITVIQGLRVQGRINEND